MPFKVEVSEEVPQEAGSERDYPRVVVVFSMTVDAKPSPERLVAALKPPRVRNRTRTAKVTGG